MKITNQLISQTTEPFQEFYYRHITLLLNDNADILDISDNSMAVLDVIIRKLKQAGNIRSFFRLKSYDTLSALFRKPAMISGYLEQFDLSEQSGLFYTSLPILNLRALPLDNGAFLGIITLSEIIPRFFEPASDHQIYLDDQERLVGFSRGFFDLFSKEAPTPFSLLGKPARELLSLTPGGFQKQCLSTVRPPQLKQFELLHEEAWENGRSPDPASLSQVRDFKPSDTGLEWAAAADAGSFISIPGDFDLQKNDLHVRVEGEFLGQGLPFILFGDAGNGVFSDTEGYLLGPDTNASRILMKRKAFAFMSAPFEPPSPGPFKLELFKTGNAFVLNLNGAQIFKYFDPDFIKRSRTRAMLYLRENNRCVLRKVRLAFIRDGASLSSPRFIAKARNKSDNFLLIDRFDSFFLASNQGRIQGYRLLDITEFQKELKTLETQYHQEVEQGHRLSAMVETLREKQSAFVGSSAVIARIKDMALRIAATHTTVLIQGPTGTGKEVLAKYIHYHSAYKEGPFLKVDCSTLPKSLIESELFGYEKGAFTGAYQRKTGLFEQAEGGTLFIDEISNLTYEVQAKLLQFLQDFTLFRVGGGEPVKVNVRLLTASNIDLGELVTQGRFREDLFYRIAVVPIAIPPLKERREDLPELCRFFLETFRRPAGHSVKTLSAAAYKKLFDYDWPGNVRQLRNVLEQALVFCDSDTIEPVHLTLPDPPSGKPSGPAEETGDRKREKKLLRLTREELVRTLTEKQGMILSVAEALNVTPRALYYHFKKLSIDPNLYRVVPHKR